jgi:hypothetical protein
VWEALALSAGKELSQEWDIIPVLVFQSLSPLIWPSGLPSEIDLWVCPGKSKHMNRYRPPVSSITPWVVGHIPRRGEWAGGHARWWQRLLADKDLFIFYILFFYQIILLGSRALDLCNLKNLERPLRVIRAIEEYYS